MKLLWMFVVIPTVFGQVNFGRSYLRSSRLCHQWSCINTKLGLSDSLPLREQTEEALRRVIPAGPWQDVVGTVLDNCYGNRTRRYTNTCPGQALLHCVVDQMIDNCPDSNWKKDDACSPVSSLAGLKYMFAQSRYDNLEKNLPEERRPSWFLRNYFDSKCCDLPVMFNMTVLQECGFISFMNYFNRDPRYSDVQTVSFKNHATVPVTKAPINNGDTLKIVDLNKFSNQDITDPLDCCDMSTFIQPSWRSECGFQLSWGGQERLVISNQTLAYNTEASVTTTTEKPVEVKDLMMVPQTCVKEECVFRNLGIINRSGVFNVDAYMKFLHNFTEAHPVWSKAKARVQTKCLIKSHPRNYDTGCEINDILSCTFDVLTENCPYTKKTGECKHGKHGTGCQISSSKYRPKNRRPICLLPELVQRDLLSQCGMESLYKAEHVAVPARARKHGWFATKYMCKDSTAHTTCLMKKMGVLNKYNFMDYFKMKDRIRQFTADQEWAALLDVYMSAFVNLPMYTEHCNSQKKLLNVVDAMLMTCPVSKRKNTAQCDKIFSNLVHTAPNANQNVTREKLHEILDHYHHIFMPNQPPAKIERVIRKKHSKTVKKPIYQFGLLNSKEAPTVRVINVKPVPTANIPVRQPMYLRPSYGHGPINDGAFRDAFSLHEELPIPSFSSLTMPSISSGLPSMHDAIREQSNPVSRIPTYQTYPSFPTNLYSSRSMFEPRPTFSNPRQEVSTTPIDSTDVYASTSSDSTDSYSTGPSIYTTPSTNTQYVTDFYEMFKPE